MPTEAHTEACQRHPRVLPIVAHAESVSDWLQRSDSLDGSPEYGSISWDLVACWLALAAGLRIVQIDLSTSDSYLCSEAWPYEDAATDTASAVLTELTRLLYIYSAVEVAVRRLTPNLRDRDPILPAARKILNGRAGDEVLHDDCGIHHLRSHAIKDSWLASDNDLISRFPPAGTRPGPAVGIEVGSKMRHLIAHGMIATPHPLPQSDSWARGGRSELCIAQHASAGLLHGLQLLFKHALEVAELEYSDECEVDDGIWIESVPGMGSFMHEFSPSDRVLTLHLQPGDGPETQEA